MKITVVLTSYNHEKFIAESIESVLQQSYTDYELIIVDDCSGDGSWRIIQQYQEQYPQIIALRNDHNWGSGVIANVVKNYAHGDYIAIHHSDDIWEKDKLEKQIKIFRDHPEYAAVFTNAQAIDDAGAPYDLEGFYQDAFSVENRTRQEWLRYFFEKGNCLCHPSILIKKTVYEENDFFKKGLRQIPDYVKWIQICKKYNIYVLPERLVKFRVHAEGKNTSGLRADTQVRSTIELYWMLEEYGGITDKEEFLGIFPEMEKEFKDRVFVPEYAWGKVCVRAAVQPYTQLFGETLLFHVMNDKQKAKVLEEQYHFSASDLIKETGKYDVFGVLPDKYSQVCSFYLDEGNGWNAEKRVMSCYALGDSAEVKMQGSFSIDGRVDSIRVRFDPAEGVMTYCRVKEFLVNGKEQVLRPENAYDEKQDFVLFVSMDPIYTTNWIGIQGEENIQIEVLAEIERVSYEQVSQLVMEKMYKNRDRLFDCEYRQKELTDAIASKDQELAEKQRQVENLEKQLQKQFNEHRIKNKEVQELRKVTETKTYKILTKVHSYMHGRKAKK